MTQSPPGGQAAPMTGLDMANATRQPAPGTYDRPSPVANGGPAPAPAPAPSVQPWGSAGSSSAPNWTSTPISAVEVPAAAMPVVEDDLRSVPSSVPAGSAEKRGRNARARGPRRG